MKVLVTGGTGVNGAFLVRRLLRAGVEPVVLDLSPSAELLQALDVDVELVRADLRDADAVAAALRRSRPEVVVHLAALLVGDDIAAMTAVNVTGTVNCLRAAQISGARRFVYASSKAAYGPIDGAHGHPSYRPLGEDAPCRPVGAYDVTKHAGEGLVRAWAEQAELEAASLRFASIISPGKGSQRHGPFGVHSRLIEGAAFDEPVELPTGGDQPDDMIYVEDVAQGLCRAALSDDLPSSVYNIGTGRPSTLREIAVILRDMFPASSVDVGPGLNYFGFDRRYYSVLDIERAGRELGYAPEYSLDLAVADYVATAARLRRSGPQGRRDLS